MAIGDLLTADLIKESLNGANKYDVIEELLDLLVNNGDVIDRQLALDDLFEREHYLSTGLENGLAVPHAKSSAVNKLMVAFGLSKQGLDFDSLDGKPAFFIFLVLSPRDTSGPHIKILAQISRNFREEKTSEELLQASSREQILEIIRSFK
jgi:fructose-specific phosphotransferase system IIA component